MAPNSRWFITTHAYFSLGVCSLAGDHDPHYRQVSGIFHMCLILSSRTKKGWKARVCSSCAQKHKGLSKPQEHNAPYANNIIQHNVVFKGCYDLKMVCFPKRFIVFTGVVPEWCVGRW
jgi:hypothetical protein